MFTGQFVTTIDGRFGISLPVPYLKRLREGENEPRSMFFVAGGALAVYTDKGFGELVFGLSEKLLYGHTERKIAALSHMVSIHEQVKSRGGRVRMPRRFRELYGFEKHTEICIAGCGDYFEIWQRHLWEKQWR